MDNNYYAENNGYEEAAVQPEQDLEERVENTFVKSLIATLLSGVPVAPIILGSIALKEYKNERETAKYYGIKDGGKHVASQILGWYGLIRGIIGTVSTVLATTFLSLYLVFIFYVMFIGVFARSIW